MTEYNDILYIVVPCYNEEEVLHETSKRLKEKMTTLINDRKISDKSRVLFEMCIRDSDKTAYATRLIEKTEYAYIVEYINKHGKQLIFTQCTRSQMENAQIGTEDAQTPPEKVELGDKSAMYCVSKKGMAFLVWDNGEYMFHITATGFGRDELFRTAMSIKELSAD